MRYLLQWYVATNTARDGRGEPRYPRRPRERKGGRRHGRQSDAS